MVTQFQRQTAIPCTLADIATGAWVQNDGLTPSGVRTGRGFISRASILGVIIEKSEAGLALEDGTSIMSVRSFEAKPVPVSAQVGDIVLVVGRPREYNGERYLVLEICKKIRNPAWVQYRKTELALLSSAAAPEAEVFEVAPREHAVASTIVTVQETAKNPFEIIVDKIREQDTGSGADIEELLGLVPDAERFVRTLLEEGEIFEIRPGRLKVLE